MRPSLLFLLVLLSSLAACTRHDPKKELEVTDVETYWVLDSPKGEIQYMAPAIRFRVRNQSPEPILSIQATANFRRVGEEENWGSAWEQVTPARKPLPPGKDLMVVLRSDARYTSPGPAESMFSHPLFKDTTAEVFLRVGSSIWVKMAESPVARQVGSKSIPPLGAP